MPRPRLPADAGASVTLSLRLTPALMRALDEARGRTGRGAFIRAAIEAALAKPPARRPAQPSAGEGVIQMPASSLASLAGPEPARDASGEPPPLIEGEPREAGPEQASALLAAPSKPGRRRAPAPALPDPAPTLPDPAPPAQARVHRHRRAVVTGEEWVQGTKRTLWACDCGQPLGSTVGAAPSQESF